MLTERREIVEADDHALAADKVREIAYSCNLEHVHVLSVEIVEPCFPDVALSSGRVIKHKRQANGSQSAYIEGDERAGMTPAEYSEYCKARGFNVF